MQIPKDCSLCRRASKAVTDQMNSEILIRSFEYTAEVISQQMAEITSLESLIQPIAGGHSTNWLLGHIVSSRSFPLKLAGESQVWDDKTRARYRDGSSPIGSDGPGVLPLDELVALFELSQRRLVAGLRNTDSQDLFQPSGYANNTVLDSLLYFHFHETYHVGQITIVAELLGKRAKYLRQ